MYFCHDDIIRSHVNAQGMRKGDVYRVIDSRRFATSFGDFVTYTIVPIDDAHEPIMVQNLHVLAAPCNPDNDE